MNKIRDDLDILFRATPPECVLQGLYQHTTNYYNSVDIHYNNPDIYEYYGDMKFKAFSPDEIAMRFKHLKQNIQDKNEGVFSYLYNYADKALELRNGNPVCKIDKILGWNYTSSFLGEDIFTTAWLAKRDCKKNGKSLRKDFDWPAIIKTNDNKLEMMFKKGLAENHYHINGSTQSFALSWAFLMNHPDRIHKLFNNSLIKKNLTISPAHFNGTTELSWEKKMLYAALIRALVFNRCIENDYDIKKKFNDNRFILLASKIKGYVDYNRMMYGSRFRQQNGKYKCLDYAISNHLYNVDTNSLTRLLAGERAFLYHSFLLCFRDELDEFDSSLLYMYLLIKSQLRQELIQINRKVGFMNFSRYQDRKTFLFDCLDEYWTEAQRMTVSEAIKNNHVEILEARIMQKNNSKKIRKDILDYDKRILFSDQNHEIYGENSSLPFFYVLHFPKDSVYKDKYQWLPRNQRIRINSKKMSQALVKFRKNNKILSSRILGIDACSNEVGCRPETFATEFRYLRDDAEYNQLSSYWTGVYPLNKLHVTYHVGEDFLDIADGLRAIDEAMLFLRLRKNDRIGHAIVLGTDPKKYYQKKGNTIYMSKQDCLDNCIWILFRSLEWNIKIDTNNREFLKREARRLFQYIYPIEEFSANESDFLLSYYNSWKLRGDHPDLYRLGKYDPSIIKFYDTYSSYMKNDNLFDTYQTTGNNLENWRQNSVVSRLYYLYHYDDKCRERSLEVERVEIREWYIKCMRDFQIELKNRISKEGIYIECNPTSNYLIGNFDLYEELPIIDFCSCGKYKKLSEAQLNASINTDDLGVFATSLENEYALMFTSLCRKLEREGILDHQIVYDYLERIRKNGIEMSFATQQQSKQMKVAEYIKKLHTNNFWI